MIEYLALIAAIPLGILFANTTKHEKKIYTKQQYFPSFLVALGILTFILSLTNQKTEALTTAFMFIMILTWWRS